MMASCTPDAKAPAQLKKLSLRIPAIDKDYIGGAILHFDAEGNMVLQDLNRENMSFSQTPSGLQYKFIGKRNMRRPLIGDVLELDMKYYLNDDSLLFDSRNSETAFRMRMDPPSHPGSIEEGFLMMAEGDSAVFKVDASSFYTYTRKLVKLPSFIRQGDKVVFHVAMRKVIAQEDFSLAMSDTDRRYAADELSMINRFLLAEELNIEPQKSGLYFISLKNKGSKKPRAGGKVEIYYNAMFLDGGAFDAVEPDTPPFSFTMGADEVIPGLEEAVGLMTEGETALAIIPFRLAYGSERYGDIPPYSTLIFEISLSKVNAK